MPLRIGLLTAAVLLAGCQYDPFAHDYTKAEPRESAVVGRYAPDRDSTELLQCALNVSVRPGATLVVNPDHTFVANELPRCWIERSFDCVPGTETWTGTWSLRPSQEWWSVQLHITSRNGQPASYGMPVMLRREKPPYLLHLPIGDPDSGNALTFERH